MMHQCSSALVEIDFNTGKDMYIKLAIRKFLVVRYLDLLWGLELLNGCYVRDS